MGSRGARLSHLIFGGLTMKFSVFAAACLFLLTGCLVDSMEKITKDTRDEVKATKEGAQIATALEVCLNPEISVSARVAGCKPVLLKLPEDRLSDYMGIPLRIMKETSVRRVLDGIEIDLPNVLYVGSHSDFIYNLELAPTSEELHNVLRMSVLQSISDVSLKAMQAGVSADDMQTYREYGRRLILVGTAILGAVKIADLNAKLTALSSKFSSGNMGSFSFLTQANQTASLIEMVVPDKERKRAAVGLRTLAGNLSLTEAEISLVDRMNELRLGIRN
jgi:hypothetical protein